MVRQRRLLPQFISKLYAIFYSGTSKGTKVENQRTNISNGATTGKTDLRVNDMAFRLVLIPFFGIFIPLFTGMVNGRNFSNWEVKLSFLYTIFIAFVIWHGNRYLHSSMRSYFDWINKPIQKIAVMILSIVFYTVPVSVLLMVGWYKIFSHDAVEWSVITEATLIILIAVIFITHVYETVFMVKESESEMIRNEQLERARAEAELEALKNQIDPHFIFNSLNTLSHLIEEKPARAKQFNDTLADVYRYILQNKARYLVLLRDEIHFLESYFLLLKIRFEKAVRLRVEIDETQRDHCLVPPISLQLLAENAIKHNEFSEQLPLQLSITVEHDEMVVRNPISRKDRGRPGSGIGLQNLRERYRLTTLKEVTMIDNGIEFIVRLPLLKIE